MHLKRLESVGFKSFAERISVDFVPGVTAVVYQMAAGKVILRMRYAGCWENNL